MQVAQRYKRFDIPHELWVFANNFELSAQTITEIYKERWQVELFFKWIKQNLKIKSFIGNSKNAILTQIWIALCTYLILDCLKFSAKLTGSLQTLFRLLQPNLFLRRNLISLLKGIPPPVDEIDKRQIVLVWIFMGPQWYMLMWCVSKIFFW